MIGVSPSGARASREPASTRWSRPAATLDDLTGLGPKADRNGLIVVMSRCHGWSSGRIATALGLTERRVQQVLRDFREVFGDVAG